MTIDLRVTAGSGMQLATIRVDPSRIRGSGGALSPAIDMECDGLVPMRPNESAIGIERVTLQLWLQQPKPAVPLGLPATRHWPGGGGFHSSNRGNMPTNFRLRFALAFEQVRLLEAAAAHAGPDPLELELRGEVSVGWMRDVAGSMDDPRRAALPEAIQMLGLSSNLWPFWVADIQEQRLYLTREQLAQNVLPGLGLDRVRLAAIRLPSSSGPLPHKLVAEYDAALRDYDAGRYREAIAKCRDVRNTVENALGAKDAAGERVADRVGQAGRASPRLVTFIGAVWKGLADLTNEAAHPDEMSAFTPASARVCLLTTAVILEAITELLSPANG
jgi:hypothetical protein